MKNMKGLEQNRYSTNKFDLFSKSEQGTFVYMYQYRNVILWVYVLYIEQNTTFMDELIEHLRPEQSYDDLIQLRRILQDNGYDSDALKADMSPLSADIAITSNMIQLVGKPAAQMAIEYVYDFLSM